MGHHLGEQASIPTSGARAVESFELDGMRLLAIPQFAYDVPGEPAGLHGGDSETDLLLLRRGEHGYQRWQTLPAPGGEDAEFFRIGDRAFLAVASIRGGRGPYPFDVDSSIFEWNGDRFEPFQAIAGFAAKQWRHFEFDGRHFLALAQGLAQPGLEQDNQPSRIYHWNGTKFEHFQDIPSQWAYNWHAFSVDGHQFLAHADHLSPSVLYRWTGEEFAPYQDLVPSQGRAFAHFTDQGRLFLVVARLLEESVLLRWDGRRFVEHQTLAGLGGRELAVFEDESGLYVARVNFLTGSPADPTVDLASQLYRWQDDALVLVEEFPTTGGTDVAVIRDDEGVLLAVTNGLSADLRFAAHTVLYRFTG
ncbi:hypothetical protein [Kutzneria sp. NPDC052558]|uniref:hypothetical protein n=1 Tax=Kutzneria sp. NPDC052558 TaxID=3364121 RepID=UPI0037C5D74C